MRTRIARKTYTADFETTVYEGQERTDVWAWAFCELNTENVKIGNRIETFMWLIDTLNYDSQIFFHNLKFDGHFILDYLLKNESYKDSFDYSTNHFKEDRELEKGEYSYTISNIGQWFNIKLRNKKGHLITFLDSYKLIPFSLREGGRAFQTKHQKLNIEYEGVRYPGRRITNEEKEYIKNDVLVLKECLEYMRSEGMKKSTIGSCCMDYFKNSLKVYDTHELFPNLYNYKLNGEIYGSENCGMYLRNSYRGGWCYLVDEEKEKVHENGRTYDANGLYSSVMHSKSGNYYPFGLPHFWTGSIPSDACHDERYFFVRFRCRFYLKEGYLPFVQIKGNALYKGTEHLRTSDVPINGKLYKFLKDKTGRTISTKVELTMTQTDFIRLFRHYHVEELEILDGCWFYALKGVFDCYIDHFQEIKSNNKGVKRTSAKLYLNNLYGQMAKSDDSSFKHAFLEDDRVKFENFIENEKEPGYIACGSAITSYAKEATIRAAQANYHPGSPHTFIYSDTDSIHITVPEKEVSGFDIHEKDLCCWKKECEWTEGWFVRQKTYIEKVNDEYNITCAGLPDILKEEINTRIKTQQMSLENFTTGFEIYGKLRPVTIPGGVTLEKTTFSLR